MTTTLEAALARARREGAEAERSRVARLLELPAVALRVAVAFALWAVMTLRCEKGQRP